MSKIKFNINKKHIILTVICISIIIFYCVFCRVYLKKSNDSNTYLSNIDSDVYKIVSTNMTKISGKSEFSSERSIFYDSTLGEIRDLKVQDKQAVQQGDVLFTYYNKSVERQISKIQQQIELNNNKINKNNSEKENYKNSINTVNNSISDLRESINKISQEESILSSSESSSESSGESSEGANNTDIVNADLASMEAKKVELENKIVKLESEIATYESKVELVDSESETLNETNDGLRLDIKFLEEDLSKDVVADISGIAHINESGKTDLTVPYIKLYSEDTVIKGEISEYDINQISLDKEVIVKIINSNEYKKGKIIAINEIPNKASNDGVSMYNFYVTVDSSVDNGFSAEIIINYDSIEIPEKYVFEENSKYFVAKVSGGAYEIVEIVALKNDELGSFYLLNAALVEGDEIIGDPSSLSQ